MTASKPQLAIIIPSYRWDALAKATLKQAAAIGSDEILVHIGDNSANPEKHAYLRSLAETSINVFVTCHETNIGADSNWLHLFKAHSTPYVCMSADDDSFVAGYFRAGLTLMREDPACATASGLHITVIHGASNQTSCMITQAERLETDPVDRLRNYKGQNAICYGIWPRHSIADFVRFIETNPLQCPFNDYMLAFHLLSMGKYRVDSKGYTYIYDGSNWQLSESFFASNARWYKGYDLPESFAFLTRLHWAVVAAHFFSSTFRANILKDEQATAIASYLFERQRREFAADYELYKAEIDAALKDHASAAASLQRFLNDGYEHLAAIFDDFASVVSVFSPAVAARYRAFQDATLQPGAMTIHAPPLAPAKRYAGAKSMLRWTFKR